MMNSRSPIKEGLATTGPSPLIRSLGTPPTIRQTYARGLLSCALWESSESEAAGFGSAVHDFIAAYWSACRAAGEDSLLTVCRDLAAQAWHRLPRGADQNRYDEYLALCERFAESHLAELDTLLRWEYTMTADVGWALLTGTCDRMDRVDGGDPDDLPQAVRITDYKTWWPEIDIAFQLQFYAQLAFVEMPSVGTVEVVQDRVRLRGPDDPVTFERGQLDPWWDEMQAGLRDVLAIQNARPTGGAECKYCRHRYDCAAATPEAAQLPENEDQADEILGELLRLTEATKARKAALEEFYRDRAPRVVGPFEIGHLQPKRGSWVAGDPMEIAAFFARDGIDPGPYLSVSSTKLRNRALRDRLEEAGLATTVPGERVFKWRLHQAPKPDSDEEM